MAKPLSTALPGPSNHPNNSSSHRPSHRRHRRRRTKNRTVPAAPSSALLSLLATIASSSSVHASPTPPFFLCPSLESLDVREELPDSEEPSSSQPVSAQPSSSPSAREARYVPDKYVQNDDGLWRKVDSYTLYGSTVAAGCTSTSCRQPTNAVSNIDDQIYVPTDTGSTTTTTTSATTTPAVTLTYDIDLPPGWRTEIKATSNRTTIIVAMSVSLAILICFLIIGCLFWRKGAKKKNKAEDVERRIRKSRRRRDMTSLERRSVESEKEAKMVQRVWARATARWKDNVRYAARQRRGKRMSTRLSQAHHSTLSIDESETRIPGALSRRSSRRSSTSSHSEQPAPQLQPSVPEPQASAAESAQAATPGLPPAYHQRIVIPPIVVSSHNDTGTNSTHPHSTPYSLSRHPSYTTFHSSTSNPSLSPDNCELHSGGAHVATDDKAILARLADLASAPPPEDGPHDAEGSHPEISVPAWEDEQPDAFIPETTETSPSIADAFHSSAFPAPPSKELLAAAERLEYTFAYDELEHIEPEPGPSAPPFEEASAHPIEERNLLPSAPPLLEDEVSECATSDSLLPSAPDWSLPDPHPTTLQDVEGEGGEGEGLLQDHIRTVSNFGLSTDTSTSANSADLINEVSMDMDSPTSPPQGPSCLPENSSPLPLYRP